MQQKKQYNQTIKPTGDKNRLLFYSFFFCDDGNCRKTSPGQLRELQNLRYSAQI